MLAHTHLMRLQRTLYDRLKGYARDVVGNLRPDLRKYFLEYQREFTDIQGVSSQEELLAELHDSHVAICGDYHTLAQAQRTVIRLLRESLESLRKRGRRVVLGLEMVRHRDTPRVAEYLAGTLGEEAFLKAIAFGSNWGFHWEHYRELFAFAREHGIEVIGINAERRTRPPTLRERDRFAARVIADRVSEDPAVTLIALIGDLHLAASHLPGALRNELSVRGVERRITVIHQNHERLYWKLATRRKRAEVVKLRDGVFCVMNTPPWVKLQSYLRWHELVAEYGRARSFAEAFQDLDYGDEIRELTAVMREFLGMPPGLDDDFKIASPADLSFLEGLGLPRRNARVLARALGEFESYFIPGANVIFLTSLSLNQAAAQAAIYLYAKLSGFSASFESPRRDFYTFLWVEALGYFGSKIVNPHRKCATPAELRARAAGSRVAHLAIRFWLASSRSRPRFPVLPDTTGPRVAVLYQQVARRLGLLLGEALYAAVLSEAIPRGDIRDLFHTDFARVDAKLLYVEWLRKLDRTGVRAAA